MGSVPELTAINLSSCLQISDLKGAKGTKETWGTGSLKDSYAVNLNNSLMGMFRV